MTELEPDDIDDAARHFAVEDDWRCIQPELAELIRRAKRDAVDAYRGRLYVKGYRHRDLPPNPYKKGESDAS